jgi:hypothetical protein
VLGRIEVVHLERHAECEHAVEVTPVGAEPAACRIYQHRVQVVVDARRGLSARPRRSVIRGQEQPWSIPHPAGADVGFADGEDRGPAARMDGMSIRIQGVAIAAVDPRALGRWWSEAVGWPVRFEEGDDFIVVSPEGSDQSDLVFLKVPDVKVVKNRLHLDLMPDDQDAEVARFEALGATRADIGQGPDVSWVVLADPEGNEFCILRPDDEG